jgi:hypothetical protein
MVPQGDLDRDKSTVGEDRRWRRPMTWKAAKWATREDM